MKRVNGDDFLPSCLLICFSFCFLYGFLSLTRYFVVFLSIFCSSFFYAHSMLWRWPCDFKHTDNWIINRFCWFLYLQPDISLEFPQAAPPIPASFTEMRPNTSTDIHLSSDVDKLTVDAYSTKGFHSRCKDPERLPWMRRAFQRGYFSRSDKTFPLMLNFVALTQGWGSFLFLQRTLRDLGSWQRAGLPVTRSKDPEP